VGREHRVVVEEPVEDRGREAVSSSKISTQLLGALLVDVLVAVQGLLGGMRRDASAAMSVAGPGRSHGTPGRWTSISPPSAKRKTVPACCSPKTSRSRRAEPAKAVHGTGRHDPHLARATHARLAVDLDEHLSFQYAQELLGPVVAVEIRDLVRGDGLNQQDEPIQPVLRPREVSDLPCLRRERH
jgi:hypothetical protein